MTFRSSKHRDILDCRDLLLRRICHTGESRQLYASGSFLIHRDNMVSAPTGSSCGTYEISLSSSEIASTHHVSGIVKGHKSDIARSLSGFLRPSRHLSIRGRKVVHGRSQVSGQVLGLEVVYHAGASNVVDHYASVLALVRLASGLRMSASPE